MCLELRGSGQFSERHCPGPACNSPALFSMPSVVVAHFTDEQLEALRDCPSPQAGTGRAGASLALRGAGLPFVVLELGLTVSPSTLPASPLKWGPPPPTSM